MNQETIIRANPAAFYPADGRLFRATVFNGAMAAFAGTMRKVVRWHRRRRAASELRSLSDQALKDIGVCRSEVLSVVNTDAFDRKVRRHAHD